MGLGSNLVTGGLGGIFGVVLVLVAFFAIPGMQKLVFLFLWLAPVFVSFAFDYQLGIILWGTLGFWVSFFLTPFVSEKLGVPGTAEEADAVEEPGATLHRAEVITKKVPVVDARRIHGTLSVKRKNDDGLIGGVMPIREAYERVCRAHDGQTEKLKSAQAELARFRELQATSELQHQRDRDALKLERERREELQRQVDNLTEETVLLRSKPVGVDECLTSLRNPLRSGCSHKCDGPAQLCRSRTT